MNLPLGKVIGALLLASGPLFPTLLDASDARQEVNLRSLLDEMVDRASLAQWPVPGYTLREASSHDRSKTDPSNPETWHSNNDHGQFIRIETNEGRQEWVIMDDHGAGAITRFWTPLAKGRAGQIVRFYFDGATTAALSVNYLDLLAGRGLARPPLAFVAWDQRDVRDELRPDYVAKAIPKPGVAGDLYLPIPFSHGCKITLDSAPFYYVINYRIYDSGATVKTFNQEDFAAARSTLANVGETLLAGLAATSQPLPLTTEATLGPNQAVSLDLPNGSAAVRALKVQIDPHDAPQVLRSTVLQAVFDGTASIWCPLGDFFGAGARLRPVCDWARTVEADGTLTARWVMPYRHTGRLLIQNLGAKPIKVRVVGPGPQPMRKWDDRSMLFHAHWRSQHGIETRPKSDWNYLEIHGQGVYVGDTLTVFSPVTAWYGEGDERIYLEDEKVPSMIGTGTEDYYGYAWGMPHFFSSPFISAPERDQVARNDWRGYTTTSRVRGLDAIPFRQELKHDMEIWDWADAQVDYSVGLFWYGRPGATSNRERQPAEAAISR